MKKMLLYISLIAWVCVGACRPHEEWSYLGQDAETCMLAIFPQGTAVDEVNSFLERHVQEPKGSNGGYTLREGISTVVKRGIEGRIAYEICFQSGLSSEERDRISEEFEKSPMLERLIIGTEAQDLIVQ